MEVPEDAVRQRRRGRTALLLTGATLLGLVAGTCVGYLVQADREPTRLPSLSQPELKQAKGEGPEPLPASRDRTVRTDGDLRKLLLKKPAGATEADWLSGSDGWMRLPAYAGTFGNPDGEYGQLVDDEFRRAAVTGWEVGNTHNVEIRLIQFRQEEAPAAADRAEGSHYWATHESNSYADFWSEGDKSTKSWPVPGTGDGMAYVHTEPETESGLPVYNAEAHAWRGDIAMEIWVWGLEPISKKTILGLAERQMERL